MKTDVQLKELAAMIEIIRKIATLARRNYRLFLLIPIFGLSTLTGCSSGGGSGDEVDQCAVLAVTGLIIFAPECWSSSSSPADSPPSPPPPPGQEFDCGAGDVQCLIQAINAANADTRNRDTINLAAGIYTLTAVNNTTDGPNGLPSIRGPLTLNGAADDASAPSAADVPRTIIERAAGARPFRLLHNGTSAGVLIQGISFRGGSTVTGEPNIHGGAIFNSGRLALRNSTVIGNQASDGFGGGIFSTGELHLSLSTVSENYAFADGGISNWYESGATGSTISKLRVTDSTISNNTSSTGGGIGNRGQAWLVNSTVSGNRASGGFGGGVFSAGYLDLYNSTVSGNSGGGIFGADHPNKTGETVRLTHTIVAGNLDQDFGPNDCAYNEGTLRSMRHNLVGAGTGCPSDGAGDQAVDPTTVFTDVLGPLQDNGGPTFTHALLPGSPAIDAGDGVCTDATYPYAPPLTTDQRGSPRPVDGDGDGNVNCDVGAFESGFLGPMPDLVVESLTHTPSNPSTLHEITFLVSVKNVGTSEASPSTLALQVGEEESPALFPVPRLAVGERYSVERRVQLVVAQTYLATAAADVNRDVAELKEANNQEQEQFVVSEGILGIPLVDQEQLIISTPAIGIGGPTEEILAQVVRAGVSGSLTEVRFPVACDSGSDLIVEIQGVAGNMPNGVVLASQTIRGTTLPPFYPGPPSFRSLVFSTPVFLSSGSPFAIVLRSAGHCSVFQGHSGDPYPGGDGFFNSLTNNSRWLPLGDFGGSDLPFQTFVSP